MTHPLSITFLLWLLGLSALAQNNITSLKRQLAVAKADTSRSRLLFDISKQFDEVNHDSCLYYLTQSLRVAQRSHDPQATATAMHRLGYIYIYYLNDNGKAMSWLNKALAIAKKENDNLNLARCYMHVAIIASQQHIGKPVEIAERALVYAKKAKGWRILTDSYSVIGYINRLDKHYRQAEAAAFQSMVICEKHNFDSWFSFSLSYCRILLLESKQDQAQLIYRKLNAVKHKLTMTTGYFNHMNSLAELELNLKNYTQAQRILVEELAAEKAKSKPDTFHLDYIYRNLLDVYERQGDTRKAYALSKQRTDVLLWLLEKRLSRNGQVQMTQLKATLDLEKKEVQIALLAQQRNQQRIYLIIAILVTVLLLGFLFILQRNRRWIERQRAELVQLNTTKDKLFAILSHDLRSPVASLQNYLMLINWGALNTEEFAESAQELTGQLNNVHTMLENVLTWSVSQMDGIHPKPEPVALSLLIDEQIQVLYPVARVKGIHIRNQIPAGAELLADKNHLAVIVRNLLQNALKFTNSGGTVQFNYAEMNGVRRIEVADTGIGMATGILDKLFQLGQSSSRMGTAHEQGTGLGLLLVQELVAVNHGQLHVASAPDQGTTFSLTFAGNE